MNDLDAIAIRARMQADDAEINRGPRENLGDEDEDDRAREERDVQREVQEALRALRHEVAEDRYRASRVEDLGTIESLSDLLGLLRLLVHGKDRSS